MLRALQIVRPVVWLALVLCLTAGDCVADTVRVTSWNLQPRIVGGGTNDTAETNKVRLPQVAAALRKLAPDVILLQGVRDWKMCEQLVQALKPAMYRVVVCSAFPETPTAAPGPAQVAILAKQRAYFVWSQPWEAAGVAAGRGSFAFAAMQLRGQRLGLFSVASHNEPSAASQLLSQVVSIRDWVTNRVQVFVVGGTFEPGASGAQGTRPEAVRRLEAAGFADALPPASIPFR